MPGLRSTELKLILSPWPLLQKVGAVLTAGPAEQQGWLHALDMLDAALSLLTEGEAAGRYAGLHVRLLQPGGDEPEGWSVPTDAPHGPEAQQVRRSVVDQHAASAQRCRK